MDIKSDISKLVSVFLEKKYNIKTNEIEIQNTKKDFQGDLTIVLFPFYKDLNKDQISSFGENLGNTLVSNSAKLELFLINAITKGTDAQAEVSVRLKENDISVSGTASDTDTMVASARAYIIALNKLILY